MTGTFYGWLVTVLLGLAGVLQIAVIRAPFITLTARGTSGRWLVAMGLFELCGRFVYLLWDDGILEVPWHSATSVALIALGLIAVSLERFVAPMFADTEPSGPVPLDEFPPTQRRG